MVSWSTIQTLLLLFGPYVFQRARAFYRGTRVSSPPLPLPRRSAYAIDLLTLTAFLALLTTFPHFHPENIFTATSSRLLQTPTDVVLTRLSKQRALTDSDEILRSRLQSRDGRHLYALFGPRPLIDCTWCTVDDGGSSFLYYALPTILFWHLGHLLVVGVVTSGRYGGVWRTQATIAAVALAAAEAWIVSRPVGSRGNSTEFTHWRLRLVRGIGFTIIDAALACAIYLTATRRWNIGWEELMVDERLEGTTKSLERVAGRLQGANFVKQTVARDKELRERMDEFWLKEEMAGRVVNEDEEVKAVRANLTGLDVESIRREAEQSSGLLMEGIRQLRES